MTTCKICSSTITDELHKRTYFDPDYPLIDIGPYCKSCIGKIRICSGCHNPGVVDVDCKYYSNGNFYCKSCQKNLKKCDSCGRESIIFANVGGKGVCENCFNLKYSVCSCCNGIVEKNSIVVDDLSHAEYPELFKKYRKVCNRCYDTEKTKFKRVPVSKCNCCSNLFSDKSGKEKYCKSCKSGIIPCHLCGDYDHLARYEAVDGTLGGKERIICNSCKNSKVHCCDSCRRYTIKPSNIHGRFFKKVLCDVCSNNSESFGECSKCLKYGKIRDGICNKCYENYGEENACRNCGTIRDFHGNCRVCEDTHVYNYSTKPPVHFWYGSKDLRDLNVIFMGIENEVTFISSEARSEALKELYTKYDPSILITKTDASISGPGYEIVTQPMTLEILHTLDMSGMFVSSQQQSPSCGMHVHVGRNAFVSDLHLLKVCQFINNNEAFSDAVAGRESNSYNSKFKKKSSKVIKDAKNGNANRHCRVNLSNRVTVEFRLFAGCVSEFTYRYRLEFVHALIVWAKNSSLNHNNYKYFVRFVSQNKKDYPNLWKYLGNNYPEYFKK